MSTGLELNQIQQELDANPYELHRDIARRLGVTSRVVTIVCSESGKKCTHKGMKFAPKPKIPKSKQGTGPRKSVLTDEQQEEVVRLRDAEGIGRGEVVRMYGIGEHAAQLAVARADGILQERKSQSGHRKVAINISDEDWNRFKSKHTSAATRLGDLVRKDIE